MLREFTVLYCVTVGILVYIIFRLRNTRLKNRNLTKPPPGPWGLPFWGHLLFFGQNPGLAFLKWTKIYGPIFFVKFGSNPAVVINGINNIKEACNLDAFAGRHNFRNFGKPSEVKGIIFTDGRRQLEQRKFSKKIFKNREDFTKSELDIQVATELSTFILALENRLKNSSKPEKLTIRHFFLIPVINPLWMSIMGHRFSEGDPRLNNLSQILANITDTNKNLICQMSWYFPWISNALKFFRKNAVSNAINTVYNFMAELIEECKGDYVTGEPKNLTHAYFDQVSETTNSESSFFEGQEQRYTTGDIFMASVDTTNTTMDWLLLFLARTPHAQRKLQSEIDDVIGFQDKQNGEPRTPSVSDRVKMPYTEAVIKETLRMSSIAPLSILRRAIYDVNFHGYKILKNTMIVPNLYGVHHNPEIWSEPHLFKPERFLMGAEEGRGKRNAGAISPFNSGKRSCIGEGFARDHLFLLTTHFFQKFNVATPAKIPSLDCVFGLVVAPHPFELLISKRHISEK